MDGEQPGLARRQRLDAVLDRVRKASRGGSVDAVESYLADLISRGAISSPHAKRVRELHRSTIEALRNGRPANTGKESR